MRLPFAGKYATRALARGSGGSSLFAILCVTVGVLVIVALQLVGFMVNAGLSSNVRALNGGDLAVHSESSGITAGQLGYFAELQAEGTITAYSAVSDADSTTTTSAGLQRVVFWAVDPHTFPLAGQMSIIAPSGATFASLLARRGAVMTDSLMQRLHLHIGQTLMLTTSSGRSGSVTITGEIANTGVISARAELVMSYQSYAAFTNLSGTPIGFLWVFVNVPGHNTTTASRLADQIGHQFPLVTVSTVPQTARQIATEIGEIRTFLRIIGLLALLIGGVGIVNTMQVLLRRRLLEIAMLKTLGYRQRELLLLFGLEALFLGCIGGVCGALLGIGVSFGVEALVERAFFLTLPTVIDVPTVLVGIGVGMATTLIFGLLPIVQTSAARPLDVLRNAGGGPIHSRRAPAAGLVVLLILLFGLLAESILGNPVVTLVVVLAAGVILGLLTVGFALLTSLVSHWPVPNVRRPATLLPIVPLLFIALPLVRFSAGFGALLLALVALEVLVACLPRRTRAEVQLSLRNIGRARTRSATTLVALFVGVFAVGMGLALGGSLKNVLAARAAVVNRDNAYILASSVDAPAVAAHLAGITGVTNQQVSLAVPDRIVAINGQPVATSSSSGGVPSNLSGVNGFALGEGSLPPATLVAGAQDRRSGRLLTPADAGTFNAVFPQSDSEAPTDLKLNDQVQVSSLDGKVEVTLRVVGFYTGLGTFGDLSAVFTDEGVATRLGQGHPFTVFAVRLPTATQNQDLHSLQQEVPGVITLGDAAALDQFDTLLNNIVEVVEVVASLAMFAGLVLIANTVALALVERRRELGMLKAIGHTSRGVLSMVVVENGILGGIGAYAALIGVSAAIAVLGRLAFQSAQPAGTSPEVILVLAATSAVLCMLVAAGVAWRSTSIRPLEVLRYE
jgi:predicted lysophospholipase L1 biosynthesis ABC-type transport system permease subunit